MTGLSDGTIAHLRALADWPDATGTKYDVLERIDQGGMGTVYRAHDRELGRDVALKVLRGLAPENDETKRLVRESRILATLEHPGLVPVHDAGFLPDGRAFYAMKLVRGSRLDAFAHGDATLAERLRVFLKICDAVAFAHAHGVLHRDLKPQNVMLGAFGEVLVMDWGVAKRRDEPAPSARAEGHRISPIAAPASHSSVLGDGATNPGTVIGTPGYMAPEQASGGTVDERTDVYGLGAILRDLVDARSDERGRARAERGVERARRGAPRALRSIVERAMAPVPEARYASVAELADDVSRFLAGERVSAHRESAVERARRVLAPHWTAIGLVAAYLAVRAVLIVAARR